MEDNNMKTLKYFALGLLALAGLALQSCNDSKEYDVKGDSRSYIYIDFSADREYVFNVAHTPLGDFGDNIFVELPVKIQYPESTPTDVKLIVDNSLIPNFRKKYASELEELGVDFSALPDEVLNGLELTNTVIPAGSYDGEEPLTMTIPQELTVFLTDPYYVVPLRVESFVKKDVRGSEEQGVAYVIIATGNKVAYYRSPYQSTNKIILTPVGVITSDVSGQFNAGLHYALPEDVELEAVVNNDLITAYNMDNGTDCVAFPDEVINQFEISSTVVPAGETYAASTIDVFLPSSVAETLPTGNYVLPLNLKTVYPSGDELIDEEEVVYAVLNIVEDTRLVKANGTPSDMLGTRLSSYAGWTSNPSGLFRSNGGVNSNYSLGSTRPGVFTVDMQSERNVTGFYARPYYGQYGYLAYVLGLEVSLDGSTWTDCGLLEEDEITFQSGYGYYVLYGPVTARYLRVTIDPIAADFGTSYNRITGFGVWVQ